MNLPPCCTVVIVPFVLSEGRLRLGTGHVAQESALPVAPLLPQAWGGGGICSLLFSWLPRVSDLDTQGGSFSKEAHP